MIILGHKHDEQLPIKSHPSKQNIIKQETEQQETTDDKRQVITVTRLLL